MQIVRRSGILVVVVVVAVAAVAVAVLGGCLQPASTACDGGGVCPAGLRCGRVGETQICVAESCGNGRIDREETCDDGNTVSGDDCAADCNAPCGDGLLDPAELCDDANRIDGDGCDRNCTFTACGNAVVTAGELCDDGDQIDGNGCDRDCSTSALAQLAYLKASNTAGSAIFGSSVALSADGSTLAVGAVGEASAATGIGGDQTNTLAGNSGAVYVFTRAGLRWSQQAYVKASNTDFGDHFGCSVALSDDGATLAVGACHEDSAAVGVGGNHADNSAAEAGAVYVFTRHGTTWSQQAYLKASNTDPGDGFGDAVALSADGSMLAVGASAEDGATTGIGGDEADNSAADAGAVYMFVRSGTTWSQQAYVKASNTGTGDSFGRRIALSIDGSTLAVAAPGEDSEATGVDGDQSSDARDRSGAVYVFTRSGVTWSQQAYVKASNTGYSDYFGSALALSDDGSTLGVGATGEASAATGIDGNQADDSLTYAGAVYVFARTAGTWSQQAYVKASNTNWGDDFGTYVALSGDGSRLAVGAVDEDSAAVGIDGRQTNNNAPDSGAVYLFTRSATTWGQQAYIKASNTGPADDFGASLALSRDGTTLAVGGRGDDSLATGVDGDQSDAVSGSFAGAVYVFH